MGTLPFRTDLSQLKRQAKDLLKEAQAGDPEACSRIAAVRYRQPRLSPTRHRSFTRIPKLAKAQG